MVWCVVFDLLHTVHKTNIMKHLKLLMMKHLLVHKVGVCLILLNNEHFCLSSRFVYDFSFKNMWVKKVKKCWAVIC
jgi:hypothetical protein